MRGHSSPSERRLDARAQHDQLPQRRGMARGVHGRERAAHAVADHRRQLSAVVRAHQSRRRRDRTFDVVGEGQRLAERPGAFQSSAQTSKPRRLSSENTLSSEKDS
jgi:hypothetical protein